MVTMQNITCSIPAGGAAALGSAACFYQAGNAANAAINETKEMQQAEKSFIQRTMDDLFGSSTSDVSHIARHSLEAVAWTAAGLALANVSVSIFDPNGSYVPHLNCMGAPCGSGSASSSASESSEGYFAQAWEMGASGVNALMDGLNWADGMAYNVPSMVGGTIYNGLSSVASAAWNNPITTAVGTTGAGTLGYFVRQRLNTPGQPARNP